METFSALLAICAGNSPVPGEFPAQRPVMRSFDVILICAWINGWVNNREAGDLRRHRAHYDTIVMSKVIPDNENTRNWCRHDYSADLQTKVIADTWKYWRFQYLTCGRRVLAIPELRSDTAEF